MPHRSFLAACVLLGVTACGAQGQQATPTSSSAVTTTTTTAPTTTTTAATATFNASANDVLTALNLQLPMLQDGAEPLPDGMRNGVFGGRTTPTIEVYVLPESNKLSKVRAVTVHVTGSGGSFQTPARLLGGVGTSLHQLESDTLEAFRRDALPKLSAITQTRTTIPVRPYYDLTVVSRDSSSLAFVFTPVGVPPLSSYDSLGK
ncbi:hypothetical protein BBK82_03485 [Lentzea guizhouensis]|uniref:Lipoprotein n=1 Tax=Lentzea guizhouensis TaxID=1586287 RepID=A0A1B2HC22_9PSEU|nr:hypothetical protein [Lentzea guizhouensis]ANZ35278.1 hypothetical protein BBK82_03485 [Lentzea guizhouensis]